MNELHIFISIYVKAIEQLYVLYVLYEAKWEYIYHENKSVNCCYLSTEAKNSEKYLTVIVKIFENCKVLLLYFATPRFDQDWGLRSNLLKHHENCLTESSNCW